MTAQAPRPFAEPWEAQVFGIVASLQDAGLFTAGEWAEALGRAIRPEGETEAVADYAHWLVALEALLAAKGVCEATALDARRDAFLRAAAATPHGDPILLENDPLFDGKKSRTALVLEDGTSGF